MTDRLPCGCPELETWIDPCPGHVWSHWHFSPINALRQDAFCFYCGEMKTQTLNENPPKETY